MSEPWFKRIDNFLVELGSVVASVGNFFRGLGWLGLGFLFFAAVWGTILGLGWSLHEFILWGKTDGAWWLKIITKRIPLPF